MNVLASRRKILAVAALSAGLTLVPAAVFASPTSHPASAAPSRTTSTTTTTTVPATTTTTTPKSTTSTASTPKAATTTAVTYEVIAGTFKTKAGADKRLAAITAKQISGLTIVKLGKTAHTTRYRIEEKGLAKADAKALVKSLRADKFFAFFTRG
jgi:hypothetical protein